MKTTFFQNNSSNIAIHQNNSSKTPILFIHGNSLSSYSWKKQFDSFLNEHYRLISIDLPGHGLSSWAENPESAYKVSDITDSVQNVIESLELNNLIIVGHSLGGHIALEIFRELKILKGLMIFGAPPIGSSIVIDDIFYTNEAMGILFKDNLTPEEIKLYADTLVNDKSLVDVDFFRQIEQAHPQFRPAWVSSAMNGGLSDEVKIVENLEIPIAIIHGEKDLWGKLSYYDKLRIPALWKGNVQVIEDSGHSPQFEKPEVFNQLLFDFASSIFK